VSIQSWSGDWERPARDGYCVNHRGGRAAQRGEAVKDRLQLLDRAQVQLEEVAVLAGNAVALGDLGQLAGDLRDQLEVMRLGLTLTMAQMV
jgi:hypothetical protein